MRYTLKRRVLGVPDFILISEDAFNQWRSTQEHLVTAYNVEATFDLLLENYAEFEQDFLRLSLRLSLFGEQGEPLVPQREMNRRVTNLLSSVRLYLDQVTRELNSIGGDKSPQAETLMQCRHNQYDSSLAYRAMECLRNHAQHYGFPVHAITSSLEREKTNQESLLRAWLQLYVDVQRLKENPKYKKTVLDELAAVAHREQVNLTPLVCEYIEKRWEVHKYVGGEIAGDVASWDQTILSVLSQWRNTFGDDLSGLAVVVEEEDEEGDYLDVESADIYRAIIDWRKQLEMKDRDFDKLSARYVTGRA
jgi:hypothetical protein